MSAFEHYISKGGRRLRLGYTTGTCAALAAGAAADMLLGGQIIGQGLITTPKGLDVIAEIEDITLDRDRARCAVRKDGGDDVDATHGLLIYADVRYSAGNAITVDGGEGIGRVTKPGLDIAIGQAAINRVPREMILGEVRRVCQKYSYTKGLDIVISAPGGEEIAKKTFNPRLGIEGGISILGTSGIVEPQSVQALVDTIEAEIKQHTTQGRKNLILTPGNYGESFVARHLGISGWPVVRVSNFVGDALDLAAVWHCGTVLIVGHIGKLVKLAGGVMNTHSRTADCRAEIFTAHAALAGAPPDTARRLMAAATTDACIDILDETGLRGAVMETLTNRIQFYLSHRIGESMRAGAVVFSNRHGLLGTTAVARDILGPHFS